MAQYLQQSQSDLGHQYFAVFNKNEKIPKVRFTLKSVGCFSGFLVWFGLACFFLFYVMVLF